LNPWEKKTQDEQNPDNSREETAQICPIRQDAADWQNRPLNANLVPEKLGQYLNLAEVVKIESGQG